MGRAAVVACCGCAERYERRSILITANQPYSGWDNVFPDPGMTVAAIDRLVHRSTIFELDQIGSHRSKEAMSIMTSSGTVDRLWE